MPCLSQEKGRGTMGRITSFAGMTLDRFPSPLPPPPGFLWSQMWLMMHLCWNDHCCDELRKRVLWRHRPSSCLEGWPGEGQRAGETREFGRMHRKPQSLTDSTSCCCSAQPLTNSVMSLLRKKGPRCFCPPHETWRDAVQDGSAGSRLEPCDSSANCLLGTLCQCLGEKTWMLEVKRESHFTSFLPKTSVFYICYQAF